MIGLLPILWMFGLMMFVIWCNEHPEKNE